KVGAARVMPELFRFANPIRIDKLTKIGRILNVETWVHWSVLVVVALILAGVFRQPWQSILGLLAYFGVFLIHETGHLIVARRLGCTVLSIRLYPVFATTEFSTPWSRLDHCMIAWGGVIAQAMIAVPLVVWVRMFGYSRFEIVNMLFAILGFFSIGVAVFNL